MRKTSTSFRAMERFCLSFYGTTMVIQWGDNHVYKVMDKVFAVAHPGDDEPARISFKVSEDSFAILTKTAGITQAPYFAKRQWVRVGPLSALPMPELKEYVRRSYHIVADKLPRKQRMMLGLDAT